MAAKAVWYRGAWWLRVHFQGSKREQRFGKAKADQRRANDLARQINAEIELGKFGLAREKQTPLPCTHQLGRWLDTYRPTLKPTTEKLFEGFIRNHLGTHFGDRDLREIREADLLRFVSEMQAKGLAPGTIKNNLGFLRQVYNSLIFQGELTSNPASKGVAS
jgi:integrase